jgi:proteasome component ECM29
MDAQQSQDQILLDRVLFRFATSADDQQFQENLEKLLVPTLQKLNSTYESTHSKVLEVLSHVNKRVRPQPNIKLPLNDLLTQYLSPDSSTLLKNFNIIYLEIAFQRAALEVAIT